MILSVFSKKCRVGQSRESKCNSSSFMGFKHPVGCIVYGKVSKKIFKTFLFPVFVDSFFTEK